jgi:hypothetical protein
VARAALDGVMAGSAQVRVRVVERWDRPYAALVARGRGAESEHLDHYLAEAATALAPVLERASLFDRRVHRERDLVAAGERRLVRLGFDLHDGPLQEIEPARGCALHPLDVGRCPPGRGRGGIRAAHS